MRTLDRLVGNCVRIQSRPDDHNARVGAGFEFFDLRPNLLPSEPAPATVWTALGNPTKARVVLRSSFATLSGIIRDTMLERVESVAETLLSETLEHVVPGRAVGLDVLVGPNKEQRLQGSEYVGLLFHQLRNAHHGYQSRGPEPRALLDSHDGHISVAFPELVVLFTVALFADPGPALRGDWLANSQ